MSSTLFRPEALEHRKALLEGDVILTRSISLSFITALLAAITTAIAAWAVLGSYSRTETVPGALDPDGVLAKVHAERAGEVIWLGAKDGDLVKAGQAIATVRIEQPFANGRAPGRERLTSVAEQARLTDEQLRLEDASSTAERARLTRLISELRQEHDQLAAQVDLQRQAVASTHSSFDALTGLVDKVPAQGVDQLGALPDERLVGPEGHSTGLMLGALHRDVMQVWTKRRFGNRRRVGRVVLLAFDEWLDVNRRDQPHFVAETLCEPPPEMARRTGLHRYDARCLLAQYRPELGARDHPVE